MQLRKIGFIALIILLVVASKSLPLNRTASFSTTQVLALSTDARKAEADRWLQQGIQQFGSRKFEAAIQSNQQRNRVCPQARA